MLSTQQNLVWYIEPESDQFVRFYLNAQEIKIVISIKCFSAIPYTITEY